MLGALAQAALLTQILCLGAPGHTLAPKVRGDGEAARALLLGWPVFLWMWPRHCAGPPVDRALAMRVPFPCVPV